MERALIQSDIAEAREALEFWSRRAERLPWHRRAHRREAREMATRWRARLIAAHLERWRLGRAQAFLMPLLDTRGRSAGRHVRSLAVRSVRRTAIGRWIMFAAGAAVVMCSAAIGLFAAVVILALT